MGFWKKLLGLVQSNAAEVSEGEDEAHMADEAGVGAETEAETEAENDVVEEVGTETEAQAEVEAEPGVADDPDLEAEPDDAGPPAEKVPVLARAALPAHVERLPALQALGEDPRAEALDNLLDILCFDVRGEVVLHASLALAGREKKQEVLEAIRGRYNDVPAQCAAGYPPRSGTGVFPKMRLLYPLAWLGMHREIGALLDDSGPWPGASKGKQAAYGLIEACRSGTAAICEKLVIFEFLDEEGNRLIMEQTHRLYPEAGLPSSAWVSVRGA